MTAEVRPNETEADWIDGGRRSRTVKRPYPTTKSCVGCKRGERRLFDRGAIDGVQRMDNPWSRAVLDEDARRLDEFERTRMGVPWDEIKSWMETWGSAAERPPPAPRR